jgi:hypothetical protein
MHEQIYTKAAYFKFKEWKVFIGLFRKEMKIMKRTGSRKDPSNGRSKKIRIDGSAMLIPIPFTKKLQSKPQIPIKL